MEIKEQIKLIPNKPGVYQYFDKNDKIIYIGKAKDLRKRVSSYFVKNVDSFKTKLLIKNIFNIKFIVVDTEQDALLLENTLIKKHQPKYNILLKDDKTFPWICVKKEAFPRVFSTRTVIRDGSDYFGPYSSYPMMRAIMDLIRQLFKYRTCKLNLSEENIKKNKFKLCLEYHIGNCMGPCVGYQSEKDYSQTISNIKLLVKGNLHEVIQNLKEIMIVFSKEYKYEQAQIIKEKIEILESYKHKSTVVNAAINNVDIFNILSDDSNAFVNYLKIVNGSIIQSHSVEIKKKINESDEDILIISICNLRERFNSTSKEIIVPFKIDENWFNTKITIPISGDKKQLLDLSYRNLLYYRQEYLTKSLSEKKDEKKSFVLNQLMIDLKLKHIPELIECFDISNIQGKHIVASCVVFVNGKPAKNEYRHYNIKSTETQDDFMSMEEVVERRYKRKINEKQKIPNLIIIDGGKGQLNSAVKSLKKLGIYGTVPVIGIAKKLEEIYFPGDKYPIYLNKKSASLKLIQSIRNEAHRFVIEFHRLKRSKSAITSELLQIKGLGQKSFEKLISKFTTIENIKNATEKDLELVVGKKVASLIIKYYK